MARDERASGADGGDRSTGDRRVSPGRDDGRVVTSYPGETDEDPVTGGGSVAGNMDRGRPVVAERIDPENALFVLLGAAVTLLVFVRFVVG